MNTLRIARLTFREAVRRKALYGAVALSFVFIALFTWGTDKVIGDLEHSATPAMRAARNAGVDVRLLVVGELLLAGFYCVSNIAALLAIFTASGIVAQEVEQGTLHSILPKPIARWQVVMGKWLGGVAMLAVYVLATGLAAVAIIYWRSGYVPPKLAIGMALLVLKATLLFTLTMLGSTFAPAIATGIAMFITYVVANVAGMVEQLGTLTGIQTMIRVGEVTSLFIPSDALWRMAAWAIQPPLSGVGGTVRQAVGPFSVASVPSPWMAVYALVYVAVMLGLANLIFARRDL